MGKKYEPLGDYLQSQSGLGTELTFAQIEKIIAGKLPPSARKYGAWWGNDWTHSHARAWMENGWAVRRVSLDRERVAFACSLKVSKQHQLRVLYDLIDFVRELA
jgi:hypothetical protein